MPTYSLQLTRSSSQYASNSSVSSLPNLNAANTISLWVMPLATAGSEEYHILYANASNRYIGLRLNSNGTIDLIWNNGANESWPSSGTAPLSVNKWHHVAMVRTNSTSSAFYVDGKQVATSGSSASSSVPTLAVVGASNTLSSDYATARVSDVRHFSTALSSAQLLEAARGVSVTGATEVHRWLLNNGYTDSVGSDNLTASGSPTFATNIPFTAPTAIDGSSLDNSVRAYYSFDEASGNAADLSGNSYTITNNGGVTYVTGKLNNASHFENTYPSNNDSFSRSGLGADLTAATISFWYKSSGGTSNGADSGIVSSGNWSASGQFAILARGNGSAAIPRLEIYGPTPDESTIGSVNVADGSWHHIVVTINTTTDQAVLYVDGKRDTYKQYTTIPAFDLTSINFYVGTYLVGTNYRGLINGDVDELYIAAFEGDYGDVLDLYGNGTPIPWQSTVVNTFRGFFNMVEKT